jgi:hypothetical protein
MIIEVVRAGKPVADFSFPAHEADMGTVHIRFGGVMGGGAPVYLERPNASETITTSTTKASSTAVAAGGDFVTIQSLTTNVLVAIGQAPDADLTPSDMIQIGGKADFGPLSYGDKVSVKDV